MIDLHTHTAYSKHGTGTVREIAEAAINKGIKILAITDHSPFPIDSNNRLEERELNDYFQDIEHICRDYAEQIKVLKGLEVDFLSEYVHYTQSVLSRVDADYIVGAIHYIFINGRRVNVWDLERIGDPNVIQAYMRELRNLVKSGLFDAVAHPDILLRGGLDEKKLYELFLPLLADFSETGLCYELNGSGFTKTSYDRTLRTIQQDVRTFPSRIIMKELKRLEIPLVVGSDSHSTHFVGKNIEELLEECRQEGLTNLVYFEKRRPQRYLL